MLTLQTLAYVEGDGKHYRLTPRILDLGFAYLTSMPIWNLAEPVMESLVAQVKESCSAAVLDATDIVYVLRVPTHKIMSITLGVGSRLPAYCTSMGRVLLADLPDADMRALLDLQPALQAGERVARQAFALGRPRLAVRMTGLRAADLTRLGMLDVAAGMSSQRGHVFLATGISEGAAQREHEEQDMRFDWFTGDRIEEMMRSGEITDAQSIAAWTLLRLHTGR